MSHLPQIGKYETLEQIGTGGFGVVYKARDPIIGRPVAIKLCTARDGDTRERFLREAQIAGRLEHPSIVTVYDFGFSDYGPYLVQEYLPGEDLAAKISRREPLPAERLLEILWCVARALRHAHEQGVLHRDVKPGNVRILEDGRVKVLDFGIAKLFGAETQLTQKGTVLGTTGYLSPEQISGKPVTEATDVFAFGVLAYELLTFEHPFGGEGVADVLRRVLETLPDPVLALAPATPPALSELVGRCLEKTPDQRPSGFAEIEAELSCLLGLSGDVPESLDSTHHPTGDGRDPGDRRARTLVLPAPPPPPDAGGSGLSDTRRLTGRETTHVPVPPPPPLPPTAPADDGASASPVTSRIRVRSRRAVRRPLSIAVAAAVLALVAAALWWHGRPANDEANAAPTVSRTVETAPAPAAATPQGTLVVEAIPWGRVTRVTGPRGAEVALPADATTPLVLRLPPGAYQVEVEPADGASRAEAGAGRCDVLVPDGGRGLCRVEVLAVEPLDYFREAGWWR